MKTIAILQSNYIPWKGYFSMIDRVDEFVILDQVQFTKNDWRNRNKIKTREGIQWLTIPVRQERLEQKICETRVSDARWSRKHWSALTQSYSRAPNFKSYADQVETWYAEAGGLEFLSDVNLLFIRRLCALFGMTTPLTPSTSYALVDDRVERLVNICQQSGASRYLSGPAARAYMNEGSFVARDIQVQWMDYGSFPVYDQRFPPFEHGVSMLDMLFNVGAAQPHYFRTR